MPNDSFHWLCLQHSMVVFCVPFWPKNDLCIVAWEVIYLPSLPLKLLLECMFFPVPDFKITQFKIQVWNFRKMSYSYLYLLKYWHYSIYIFERRLPITFLLKVIFIIHVLFLSWLINFKWLADWPFLGNYVYVKWNQVVIGQLWTSLADSVLRSSGLPYIYSVELSSP